MNDTHNYTLQLNWLGDENGKHHRDDRNYEIEIEGKPVIKGSADKPFFGDPKLFNPEDLLLSALSACHMMSFLYLCRKSGYTVKSYTDKPIGTLVISTDGSGKFDHVVLKPFAEFTDSIDQTEIIELHKKAGKLCFIANSVNFSIDYDIQSK